MPMHKKMQSADVVIVGGGEKDAKLFRPGSRYVFNGTTYTVIKAYYTDNTEMREVVSNHGDKEILTVETMKKDAAEDSFKQIDSIDLPDGE